MNHLLFSLPLALCLLGSLSAAAGDSLRVVKGQVSNYYIPVVNEYQLTGRVTDGSGKPLQGATVMFFASPVHCNTDAQGRFSLKATDADLHLYVYYPGMKMSNLMRTKNQREVSVVMAPGRADAGEDGRCGAMAPMSGRAVKPKSHPGMTRAARQPPPIATRSTSVTTMSPIITM